MGARAFLLQMIVIWFVGTPRWGVQIPGRRCPPELGSDGSIMAIVDTPDPRGTGQGRLLRAQCAAVLADVVPNLIIDFWRGLVLIMSLKNIGKL